MKPGQHVVYRYGEKEADVFPEGNEKDLVVVDNDNSGTLTNGSDTVYSISGRIDSQNFNLVNLEYITFSDNRIQEFPKIRKLRRLKYLNCYNNYLENFPRIL